MSNVEVDVLGKSSMRVLYHGAYNAGIRRSGRQSIGTDVRGCPTIASDGRTRYRQFILCLSMQKDFFYRD